MRMRLKKHLTERLSDCQSYFLDNDCPLNALEAMKSPKFYDFNMIFGNSNPIALEIGCGKGGFAVKFAQKYQKTNFVAVERLTNVAIVGAEEAASLKLPNLKFLVQNAEFLACFIPPKSVSMIYLNFSCPYPKKTYANRRLTHHKFLQIYSQLLTNDGRLCLKTDNVDFFDFSLQSLSEAGWKTSFVTRDLYSTNIGENIQTEYEKKFVSQGKPICAFVAEIVQS